MLNDVYVNGLWDLLDLSLGLTSYSLSCLVFEASPLVRMRLAGWLVNEVNIVVKCSI